MVRSDSSRALPVVYFDQLLGAGTLTYVTACVEIFQRMLGLEAELLSTQNGEQEKVLLMLNCSTFHYIN